MTYAHNLWCWLVGFARLRTIPYKPGWGPWSFLPLYLVDYGSHVLTGGACVSWSRWFHDHPEYRLARFATRILNRLDPGHGAWAGPALWGTVDCPMRWRLGWAAVLVVAALV